MKTVYSINGYIKLAEEDEWKRVTPGTLYVPEDDYEKVNELLIKNGFSHFIYTLDAKVMDTDDELSQ